MILWTKFKALKLLQLYTRKMQQLYYILLDLDSLSV